MTESRLGGGKIEHVVVIVQENRSFDTLFHGFPGADTVNSGYGHGRRFRLTPISFADPRDINHAHLQFVIDYDRAKDDGYDFILSSFAKGCRDPYNNTICWKFVKPPASQFVYSFVKRSETVPYWTMAREYALADRTFQSNSGPSYPSHQYLIAGQSGHVVENAFFPTAVPPPQPTGCDAHPTEETMVLHYGQTEPPQFAKSTGIEETGPYPCFQYDTIATTLDAAHLSWAYYTPAIDQNVGSGWNAFEAIYPVRFGEDWYRNVKSPETRFFNDIDNGRLAAVSWIVPAQINSDHAGSRSTTGPEWVASIVNTIGASRYWDSTAIVILWDDWGGWYDHVLPPQYPDPRTGANEGLGFRIPLIVVSPFARRGYISHRQHELDSTLHFIESIFALPSLGRADARADDLSDMFDFKQRPAPFRRIPERLSPRFFRTQVHANLPPDDD